MATSKVAASGFPAQPLSSTISASGTFKHREADLRQASQSLVMARYQKIQSTPFRVAPEPCLGGLRESTNFRPGHSGACEATLCEFTGPSSSSASQEGQAEQTVARVAAADILEALAYLRWRPEFELRSAMYRFDPAGFGIAARLGSDSERKRSQVEEILMMATITQTAKHSDQAERQTNLRLSRRNRRAAREKWSLEAKHPLLLQLDGLSEEFGLSVSAGDVILLQGKWYITHGRKALRKARAHATD